MQTNVTLLELHRSTVQVATVCYRYFIQFFFNKRHLAEWGKIFVNSTKAHKLITQQENNPTKCI